MSAKYTVSAVSEAQNQAQSLFRYIAPELILANPKQPRRSIEPEALATLKESIRERGILQPLLVMRGEGGKYILVAGQRRLAAARELNLVRVPVMVLNESRPDYLVDSLLENIQREELSGIDEGYSFISLKDEFGWSQREIAARIHKHESYVSERIRTAERLTSTTKEIILEAFTQDNNLAHAKFSHSINRKLALLPAEDQERLAREVASTGNITARQIEALVRSKLGNGRSLKKINSEPGFDFLPEADTTSRPSLERSAPARTTAQQMSLAEMMPGEGFETSLPEQPIKKPRAATHPKKAQVKSLFLTYDLTQLNPVMKYTIELITKQTKTDRRLNLKELLVAIEKDYEALAKVRLDSE